MACLVLLAASATRALVMASPDVEPRETFPADFPYWENVTQRRYESPSVIYLGHGFAVTARHVGPGEIFLRGEIVPPVAGWRRTLINRNGTPADAMLFRVELPPGFEDLPPVPIAKDGPRIGEEVVMIGFGRVREKVVDVATDGPNEFGFSWSAKGSKRWGTNRVASIDETLSQGNWTTHSFTTLFDPPSSPDTTEHEAHATVGDSGGAVFAKRDGKWWLVGMMTSVTGFTRIPVATTLYGDATYAADLSVYREEILRWASPECSNELDDDGDDAIDFPADPDCDSATDGRERNGQWPPQGWPWLAIAAAVGLSGFGVALRRRRQSPPTEGFA